MHSLRRNWWISLTSVWPRCFSRISCCRASFPGLWGRTPEQIDAIRLDGIPLIDPNTLALLQSWLIIGLLESIIPRYLASKDWIFNAQSSRAVRTHNLRKIMYWAERFISQSNNETQQRNARIFHRVFTIAQYWNRHLFIQRPWPTISLKIFDAVRWLMIILRKTLDSILVNFLS